MRIKKDPKTGLLLAALCLLFIAAPISAQATDYYVPGDFTKIQAAITAASSGDTVHVAAGTYATSTNGEAFPLSMKNGVSLQGDGAATTILDAENASSKGVISASNIASPTTLDGFTITNGNEVGYVGGGINSVGCTWTVSNCIITSNNTTGFGGGINCESTDKTTFTNCTITDNTAGGAGGVEMYYHSTPTFNNCVFSDNSANAGGAILVEASGTPATYGLPKFTNCTITNNTAANGGGAFYGASGSAIFTNCTIAGNSAPLASALLGENSGSTNIVNSIIWGNTGATYEIDRVPGQTFSIALNYSDRNIDSIESGVSMSGGNNINLDPEFINPGVGNYHLDGTVPSPCIDSGTDDDVTYPSIPSDDIDGDSRPQGSGYDMGSDEYAAAAPTCVDDDGDGYGVCPDCGIANGCTFDGDDCDDTPGSGASINPGATEITCNGVDENCNGMADDAPPL